MNKLKLKNGEEFAYIDSFYSRELETLSFEFSQSHTHDDIFNVFSVYGENYDEGNLNTITLTDDEGNVLGIWEGFNDLSHIQNNLRFAYSPNGDKTTTATVKITLLKETISDEYKRIKENEIQSLQAMNLMLMLALAETAEVNADDKISTEIALAELAEILREKGVL